MRVAPWFFPALWRWSRRHISGRDMSHTILFWSAFILTRPLGATLGDLLTKPVSHGGLYLGRIESSLVIALFIVVAILFSSREAGRHPGAEGSMAEGDWED